MDQTLAKTRLKELPTLKCARSRYRSTSQILHDITGFHGEHISIQDLYAQLGDRGFGLMFLLFALPNIIPLPMPGVSTLTSLPIIFFSAQLCLGKSRVWIPAWLGQRTIPMATLKPLIHKSYPYLMRLEKMVKPRLDTLTSRRFERIAGGLILLLALLIALPIPFGNLPLALAITVMALAITERDGLMMIIGWLFTIFALCFFVALVSGYVWVIWSLISGIF